MNILVIGSGGREHSILLKLKESSRVENLFCLPGNAGTREISTNVDMKVNEFEGISQFAKDNSIDLVVVGPEDPLTDGITDHLENNNLTVFGPSKNAAQIEGSKVFSKELMKKYKIPTAAFETFSEFEEAVTYLKKVNIPIVIKASGNAAGKGSVICETMDDAKKVLNEIMVKKIFGDAGNEVVIEEFMRGEEASVFAICDGKHYKIMVTAQDHKAVYDGDKGPNTGGMGTYAPAPVMNNEMLEVAEKTIIAPVLDAMKKEGCEFRGVLFTGLMITDNGPKVVEFNCRFGDPETQVVLPLYDGDFAKLLFDAAKGSYENNEVLPAKNLNAVCVVMASGGYPGSYEKGKDISGLQQERVDILCGQSLLHL